MIIIIYVITNIICSAIPAILLAVNVIPAMVSRLLMTVISELVTTTGQPANNIKQSEIKKVQPLTDCTCAEDEGFKPPIPGKGYTGFRVQRIRSLCQSSLCQCKSTIYLS